MKLYGKFNEMVFRPMQQPRDACWYASIPHCKFILCEAILSEAIFSYWNGPTQRVFM